MGKSSAPPAPDMTPVYNMLEQQYKTANKYMEKYWSFANKQFKWTKGITRDVLKTLLPSMEHQLDMAVEDRQRWEDVFRPQEDYLISLTQSLNESQTLQDFINNTKQVADSYAQQGNVLQSRYWNDFAGLEDQLVDKAYEYDTMSRRESEAGRRIADVTQMAAAEKANRERQMEGMGIDPSSGRWQGANTIADIGEAAAKAAAAAEGRRYVEQKADDYRAQAITLGSDIYNRGLGLTNAGVQMGQAAVGAEEIPLMRTQNVVNLGRGYPAQYGASFSGAGGAGSQAMAGAQNLFNSGAGALGGVVPFINAGTTAASNYGNLMNNVYGNQVRAYAAEQANNPMGSIMSLVGGMFGRMGFSEGGHVPDFGSDPTDRLDTIPANLSENEYVIPADVVKRKGTEFFEKLIGKSREGEQPKQADPKGAADGGLMAPHTGTLPLDAGHPRFGQPQPNRGGPSYASGGPVTGQPTAQPIIPSHWPTGSGVATSNPIGSGPDDGGFDSTISNPRAPVGSPRPTSDVKPLPSGPVDPTIQQSAAMLNAPVAAQGAPGAGVVYDHNTGLPRSTEIQGSGLLLNGQPYDPSMIDPSIQLSVAPGASPQDIYEATQHIDTLNNQFPAFPSYDSFTNGYNIPPWEANNPFFSPYGSQTPGVRPLWDYQQGGAGGFGGMPTMGYYADRGVDRNMQSWIDQLNMFAGTDINYGYGRPDMGGVPGMGDIDPTQMTQEERDQWVMDTIDEYYANQAAQQQQYQDAYQQYWDMVNEWMEGQQAPEPYDDSDLLDQIEALQGQLDEMQGNMPEIDPYTATSNYANQLTDQFYDYYNKNARDFRYRYKDPNHPITMNAGTQEAYNTGRHKKAFYTVGPEIIGQAVRAAYLGGSDEQRAEVESYLAGEADMPEWLLTEAYKAADRQAMNYTHGIGVHNPHAMRDGSKVNYKYYKQTYDPRRSELKTLPRTNMFGPAMNLLPGSRFDGYDYLQMNTPFTGMFG